MTFVRARRVPRRMPTPGSPVRDLASARLAMKLLARLALAVVAGLALGSASTRAGMPYFPLTEVPEVVRGGVTGLSRLARERLEAGSFFLVGVLGCAGVVRAIWNGLRSDFPALPRLSFGKALGLVFLWGCLFVLVLTMISGARELMTPGAWQRKGLTYKLAEQPLPPSFKPDPSEV